jgi:hypothetical protein
MAIQDTEKEAEVLSRAWVSETNDPGLNHLKVIHLRGTPYEMGFQHGRLLQDEVRTSVNHVMTLASRYADQEMMDEVYDLMAPYIPLAEKEEMRGLAHGAGLSLRLVHWYHAIPAVSEYGDKRRLSKRFSGTSCSNLVGFDQATIDGGMYQMRVLDWNRRLGVHQWPVILVHEPVVGNASVTYSFAGFIGCVTGMNDRQMAFGEMGYGNPPNETLEGIPFVFLFRQLMREASTLEQAAEMIRTAARTCSYVYLISDAKQSEDETNALLFITDRDRFLTFRENTMLADERDDDVYPAIDDMVYAGAKSEVLHRELTAVHGRIDVPTLMEISKKVSLNGNIQNVIFKPETLESWSSYATTANPGDKSGKACNQKWFYFDFKKAMAD